MTKNEEIDQILTVEDASAVLSCSQATIWRLIRDRKIGHVRVNRRVGISTTQLRQYIELNSVDAIDSAKLARKIWERRLY